MSTQFDIKLYEIIKKPVITEKASAKSDKNEVVFEVMKNATKDQVKLAVQTFFNVEVKAVNTLIRKGKNKNFKGRSSRLSDKKIAYVSLKNGQSIDLSSGI